MTERDANPDDAFDRIVEGLNLDLEFPDEVPEPVRDAAPLGPSPEVVEVEPEEPFYRKVDATPLLPRKRGTILAWCALVGTPLLLVMMTVIGEILPRPILGGAVLTFVAAAIYLVAQLPEHGPARPDWPDDGAVL